MDCRDFKARTEFLGPPPNWDHKRNGLCGSLPVHHDGLAWTSCWKPTEKELKILNEGGFVWLRICTGQRPQPPVAIYANHEEGDHDKAIQEIGKKIKDATR